MAFAQCWWQSCFVRWIPTTVPRSRPHPPMASRRRASACRAIVPGEASQRARANVGVLGPKPLASASVRIIAECVRVAEVTARANRLTEPLSLVTTLPVVFCPASTDFDAEWPASTRAGETASGALCKPGYTGFVSRLCDNNGHWATTYEGACTRTSGLGSSEPKRIRDEHKLMQID